MKAIFLTSVLVALFFSANLNANNVKTYSNEQSGEFGIKKEYISVEKETLKPLKKEYYQYDTTGRLLEKTVSKWSYEKGWENTGRYEYQYNETGKVANVIYTEWNKQSNDWAEKACFLVHVYDDNNEFLSIEQFEINTTNNNLITLN